MSHMPKKSPRLCASKPLTGETFLGVGRRPFSPFPGNSLVLWNISSSRTRKRRERERPEVVSFTKTQILGRYSAEEDSWRKDFGNQSETGLIHSVKARRVENKKVNIVHLVQRYYLVTSIGNYADHFLIEVAGFRRRMIFQHTSSVFRCLLSVCGGWKCQNAISFAEPCLELAPRVR